MMFRPDDAQFRFIGKPIPRKEDERLVTGRGRFSDDFSLEGQTYAVMVRSPHPHARIAKIDSARARAMPALTRALIRALSNWARDAITVKIISPWGVVVSMFS